MVKLPTFRSIIITFFYLFIADITAIICSDERPFSCSIACSSFDLFVSSAAAGVFFFAKTLRRVSSVFAVSKLPIYRSVVARLLWPNSSLTTPLSSPVTAIVIFSQDCYTVAAAPDQRFRFAFFSSMSRNLKMANL